MTAIILVLSGLLLAYLIHTEDVSGSIPEARRVGTLNGEDAAITAMVKTALSLSKRVSSFHIDVSAQGGTVTLTGKVPSEAVSQSAGAIAEDTRGVEKVRNLLVVEPGTQPHSKRPRFPRKPMPDIESADQITDLRSLHKTDAVSLR